MNGFGRGKDEQKEKKSKMISRETVGMTLLLFSTIAFLIAVTGPYLFGDVGLAITAFFCGALGFAAYPALLLIAYLSLSLVIGKSPIDLKLVLRGALVALAAFFIVHVATAPSYAELGFGGYMSACWHAAESGAANSTGGGVILGIVAFPVCALVTNVGAYVFFSLLTVLAVYFFLRATPLRERMKRSARPRVAHSETPAADVRTEGARPYPGAMQFGDLPDPARAQMPQSPQPYAAPEQPRAAAQRPAYDRAAEGREILFGSDPASNYRSNLIYDRDSYFNTHARGSNVVGGSGGSGPAPYTPPYTPPATSYAPPANTPPAAPSAPLGYSESYAAHAEEPRPAFPRKVTEERPHADGGYSYPVQEDYDANYTQTPSYRAPQEPAEPANRNYYAHDVEPEFSSQPNVYDEPAPRPQQPETPPASRFAQPETPPASRFAQPETPPASRFAQPETPPASRFAQPETPPASRFAQPETPPASRFAQPETPPASRFAQPETPPEQIDNAGREAGFRSLFSRPLEERTHIEKPLPFDDNPPASRFNQPETPPASRIPPDVSQENPRTAAPSDLSSDGGYRAPAENDLPDPDSRVFRAPVSDADLFDDDDFSDGGDFAEEPEIAPRTPRTRTSSRSSFDSASSFDAGEEKPAPAPARHIYREYVKPSTANFSVYDDTVNMSQDEIERNTATIVDTLAGFKVDAEVVKVTTGPAVTRYDIDIPRNITVGTVIKRDKEIALRLHARDGVNMYANTASGTISIEVPNVHRATVGISSVLEADEYVNAKEGSLMFVIGKDVENKSVCGNIAKMKHLLIAGSTGSGKSVCLNAMLISLICKYSPEDLRLILIDPKKVEFAVFDGLPHLMINEIIADAQKAVMAFKWAIEEMERRYRLFEQKTREQHITVRNVDEYNSVRTEDEAKLPKIVIVVDELADLMSVEKKNIEERIQRIAQKARAAGIHLVIATQRPSVDVITGVIKGNLPTRIAFRVIQEVDSRTILDETGAEKLLGNGDMLFRTEGMFNCLRVQGAFLSSGEVQAIIDDIKANNEAYFDDAVASYINNPGTSGVESGGDENDGAANPQYIRALAIVVKLGQASISLIQRKCSVGYNHAGKIIEWMEAMGYISAFDGKAKARDVLMTQEEFEAKYGSID